MMIDARNYRMCPKYPFTASQWEELEQQALVFRYLVAGVPVPPHLISTLITTPSSSSSRLLPQQLPLPIGWGCFQVGFGRKVDPEPGRCRRTDGKKWRCSKDAFPDSKYCEKHMHRGKTKSKKHLEKQPANDISYSVSSPSNTANYAQKCPSQSPFYPFLSPNSSSESTMPTPNQIGPHNLLGHGLYYGQPNKDIKFDSTANYRS